MEIISYISTIMIPAIIVLIVAYGVSEKKPVFDLFIKGAKEGLKITIKLFPTLLRYFLSCGYA